MERWCTKDWWWYLQCNYKPGEFRTYFKNKTLLSNEDSQSFESGVEGKPSLQITTKYERDQKLRKQAILIHGYTCVACGFNFEEFYGDYAKGFIHIHHIEPLFSVGEK